jgi:hypothetical protein
MLGMCGIGEDEPNSIVLTFQCGEADVGIGGRTMDMPLTPMCRFHSPGRHSATQRVIWMLGLAAWIALVGNIAPSRSAEVPRGSRHIALVIGNSAYDGQPKLAECAVAARTMIAVLRNSGFEVIERLDASNGEIGGGLAAVAHRLADAGSAATSDDALHPTSALVYACGYASGFDGRAFLLPVSVRIERAADLLTQGVLAKSLGTLPAAAGARNSLVLLDLVRLPGNGAVPEMSQLAREASGSTHGFIAASSDIPAAGSPTSDAVPTKLASAAAAAFADGPAEAGAVVTSVRRMLERAGDTTLAVGAPLTPAWLIEPLHGTEPGVLAQAGRPEATMDGNPTPSIRPVPTPALAASPVHDSAASVSPGSIPAPAALAAPVPEVTIAGPNLPLPTQLPDERQQTDKDRRLIQAALARLGYYAGSPDGVYGPETRAAMRRFQHEIGAEQTGRLTAEQAAKLVARAS